MPTKLALATILLAACGTDDHDGAVFSNKSDLQLERTMTAALTGDVSFAILVGAGYASATPGPGACPQIADANGKRTVTGGCTTSDGTRIDGGATLDNVPGLFGGTIDTSRPSVLDFAALTLTDASDVQRFDGSLSFTATTADASLAVDLFGIRVTTDAEYSCPAGTCSFAHATIDVDGVGSATVTGTWTPQGDSPTVAIDIHGQETLSIASVPGNSKCMSYSIDGGTSRQLCGN